MVEKWHYFVYRKGTWIRRRGEVKCNSEYLKSFHAEEESD
jgi:hypothetical protein